MSLMSLFAGCLGILLGWSGIGLTFLTNKLCDECNKHQLWRNHVSGEPTKMGRYLVYTDRIGLVFLISGVLLLIFAIFGG